MNRKLATIQEIIDIKKINEGDKIEVAQILGWQCVVKKDEFKIGDLVVYVKIESVLPEKPEFEFLRNRKFRIKTIKLKGQVSQGLLLPLNYLPTKNYKEGDDVSEILEVTKYLSRSERNELEQFEKKLLNDKNKLRKFLMRYSFFRKLFVPRNEVKGFPVWVSKTDEERIQNIPQVLNQYDNNTFTVTEKIDYQSVTFTSKMLPRFGGLLSKILPIKKYKFIVASRNFTTNNKSTLYWQIAKKYNIEEILKENKSLTLQGEQGSAKVQDNKYGLKDIKLWVFNIYNHDCGYHYSYAEKKAFCDKYKLECVPLLRDNFVLPKTVEEMVELSKGKSSLANIHREGIVVRCIENGRKILSFKVINPDFLLKYD